MSTKLRFRPTGLILSLVLIGAPFIAGGLGPAAAALQGTGRTAPPTAQAQPQPQSNGQQAAPSAGSQRPAGRPDSREWEWWKDAEVQKALGLTDAKVRTIAKLFDDRLRRSQPIWEQFEKEREALNRLTAEQKISVEMYAIEVRKVEVLRTMLNESRLVMLYRIYRELTPEQYQKLQEIRDKRFSGRGRGTGPHF